MLAGRLRASRSREGSREERTAAPAPAPALEAAPAPATHRLSGGWTAADLEMSGGYEGGLDGSADSAEWRSSPDGADRATPPAAADGAAAGAGAPSPYFFSSDERPLNCRHEWLQPARDGVPVSMELLLRMLQLYRAHADENGEVAAEQLAKIRASDGYAEICYHSAELRRVDPSALGEGERLALWLNVYNLLCMHGYVEYADRCRARVDILVVLRLHRRFKYNIGGQTLSALQIEHAVLRNGAPRPDFVGTRLVIPKFSAADPRLAGAPGQRASAALLTFGLHPGTAFAPPLRIYNSRKVRAELADNARAFLREVCEVRMQPPAPGARAGGAVCVTLPIQLLWHHLDFGAPAASPELLRALLPLLPSDIAATLGAQLKANPLLVTAQYRRHSWEVRYKVAESKRQSDRDSGAFFFGGGGGAASSERSSSSGGGGKVKRAVVV